VKNLDFINDADELKCSPMYKILKGNIVAYGLEEKVNLNIAVTLAIAFNLNNPGMWKLLLIDLLNFYVSNNKPATIEDLSMFIYPMGFYDDKSFIRIVDDYLKPNLLLNSEMY